jgi:hypothetical protein
MSEDIPRKQHSRYYEDSDDMVERIRRLRAAFEKKINSFQGVDWPYYEKRVIVGKKKKDEAPSAAPQPAATPVSSVEPQAVTETEPSAPPTTDGQQDHRDAVLPSDQSAAWWEARRRAQKAASAPAHDKKKLPPDGSNE